MKRANIGEPNIEENHTVKDSSESNFAQKRASHYNEYYVLKAMRNVLKEEENEEEEEEDDHN